MEEASRGLLLRGTRARKLEVPVPLQPLGASRTFHTHAASQPGSRTTGGRAGSVETHGKKERVDHRVSAVSVLGRAERELSAREKREGRLGTDAGRTLKDLCFILTEW